MWRESATVVGRMSTGGQGNGDQPSWQYSYSGTEGFLGPHPEVPEASEES
ncbi:hypothetical protein OG321_37975 [Streptomyces sp. NBC_00424]|nr:hypothetical protein [Streptomyces sp. NBC_00424]MCX5078237.1 hypothetical protein [Streptomyces sp. NBC_00424]